MSYFFLGSNVENMECHDDSWVTLYNKVPLVNALSVTLAVFIH